MLIKIRKTYSFYITSIKKGAIKAPYAYNYLFLVKTIQQRLMYLLLQLHLPHQR